MHVFIQTTGLKTACRHLRNPGGADKRNHSFHSSSSGPELDECTRGLGNARAVLGSPPLSAILASPPIPRGLRAKRLPERQTTSAARSKHFCKQIKANAPESLAVIAAFRGLVCDRICKAPLVQRREPID